MDKKFKIGIIGLMRGSVPLYYLKRMSEYVTVTAVVEKNPDLISAWTEHKEDWKDGFPEETVVYDTYEEMLDSGIDAVVLCDNFTDHCQRAIQALDKGIAVFSETTAAPTLGDCVDLVEAVERNDGKYMLMANCPFFKALQFAKKKMENDEYGPLLYADAEYIHPVNPDSQKQADMENLHWRDTLPTCYYNMHSLGPLMFVSGAMPKKVLAKAVINQHKKRPVNTPKTFNITEMDNGAIFNSTGCVGIGTMGKWYRFAFESGTLETERGTETPEILWCSGLELESLQKETPTWVSCGALTEEEQQKHDQSLIDAGHGGVDLVMTLRMVDYLRGEYEPFFDVYRSVALSAVGILSWYSILDGSKEYEIPDFKNPADRDKVRGDYRKPFGKTLDELTLPCRIEK